MKWYKITTINQQMKNLRNEIETIVDDCGIGNIKIDGKFGPSECLAFSFLWFKYLHSISSKRA